MNNFINTKAFVLGNNQIPRFLLIFYGAYGIILVAPLLLDFCGYGVFSGLKVADIIYVTYF
jgi:hypothetical protein